MGKVLREAKSSVLFSGNKLRVATFQTCPAAHAFSLSWTEWTRLRACVSASRVTHGNNVTQRRGALPVPPVRPHPPSANRQPHHSHYAHVPSDRGSERPSKRPSDRDHSSAASQLSTIATSLVYTKAEEAKAGRDTMFPLLLLLLLR